MKEKVKAFKWRALKDLPAAKLLYYREFGKIMTGWISQHWRNNFPWSNQALWIAKMLECYPIHNFDLHLFDIAHFRKCYDISANRFLYAWRLTSRIISMNLYIRLKYEKSMKLYWNLLGGWNIILANLRAFG